MQGSVPRSAEQRSGWAIPAYCAACGFSRATYYNLPAEVRPYSVKVGRRRIIIEGPDAYLARLAAMQDATRAVRRG